jgi:hypothetical protein
MLSWVVIKHFFELVNKISSDNDRFFEKEIEKYFIFLFEYKVSKIIEIDDEGSNFNNFP